MYLDCLLFREIPLVHVAHLSPYNELLVEIHSVDFWKLIKILNCNLSQQLFNKSDNKNFMNPSLLEYEN